MRSRHFWGVRVIAGTTVAVGMLAAWGPAAVADVQDDHFLVANNAAGQVHTLNVNGELDLDNPFKARQR